MAQSSRTFRIFVSSTFSDLKSERNALQEKVFPRLRDLATAHGCRFQAIDLRWGVSEEAALDQQTMQICLGEIKRCQRTSPKPNFIILLGDRYGWRPLPAEIPADEFEQIIALVAREDKPMLERWYRRDDNAVPAVYCLQPRENEFVPYKNWEQVETRLRQILQSAVGQISFSAEALLKYNASATEQEIDAGAMKVPDANEHVFCFFRDIQGLPDDGSAAAYRELDPDAAHQQHGLKARLKQKLPGNVHEYAARWQNDGPTQDHLDQLCEDVYAELSKVILAEARKLEIVDALEKEISAHAVFGKERASVFIGQTDLLYAIEKYIGRSDTHPLAIWGASGSGKSALMAKAVEQTRQNGADVIYRFSGTTPDSSNGRMLLESLCRQISRLYGTNEASIPSEYKDLVQEFSKCLGLAIAAKKPLVLFLDALDQLSDTDNARSLVWLPADLPPNVHLIVSTLPGECLKALENKLPVENQLEVQPMSLEDGKNILTEWLRGANRQLEPKQTEYLLDKFRQSGLPLYLKLAFEEARLWKSYSGLPELSADIPGILRNLFGRLSKEANHGKMLVSRSLGYLAAAKNGLSEDELLDVLSSDQEMLTDFQRRSPKSPQSDRLPVVIWSRLYFDLEPYLSELGADETTLLSFYHTTTIKEAVKEQFMSGNDKHNRHIALANYFNKQPLQILHEDENIPNLRKLSELVHNLSCAELWEQATDTLTNPHWIQTYVQAGRIYELPQIVQEALNTCTERDWIPVLTNLYRAIYQEAWRFAENPQLDLIACQMEYHLSEFAGQNGQAMLDRLEKLCVEEKIPILRLLSRRREKYHPVLSEHGSAISFALASADGDYAASVDNNGVIQGFNPKTGERLWNDRLYAVLWVGNVINANGKHPTERRWTHPNNMLISGGKDPNLWINAKEQDNTLPSSEVENHVIILNLRNGKEKQRYVFRKVWKQTQR
ncbi:MAG: DUF4062 domain-containing protein [Chloroflexota bacterium]